MKVETKGVLHINLFHSYFPSQVLICVSALFVLASGQPRTYGKREADAEPKADADPKAEADPYYYGGYRHNAYSVPLSVIRTIAPFNKGL